MKHSVHYNPENVSAYVTEKTSSRLLLSHTRHFHQSFHHLNIASGFTNEYYDLVHIVYVKTIPLSDGSVAFPNLQYGILCKTYMVLSPLDISSLYPYKIIWFPTNTSNLRQNPASIIRFLYLVPSHFSEIDDCFVTAPSYADIDTFLKHLHFKYTLKYLGIPSSILGCKVDYNPNGDINISQHNLIAKFATKINLTQANPRSTPLPQKPIFD